MGTVFLLRPDNSSSIIRPPRNPNPNHTSRKKRIPTTVNPISPDRNCTVMKHPGSNLVMGQVKILKRGEKLSPDNLMMKSEECYDLVLGSTDRLGPDPVTVMNQVRVQEVLYAGLTVLSPPPSSVPVPKFLVMEKP